MKKLASKIILFIIPLLLVTGKVEAQYSFSSIDDFETGKLEKWYKFGNVSLDVVSIPTNEVKDSIAESCGLYSLQLNGTSESWYVGGLGRELNIEANGFARFQMDVYGSVPGGKLKVEFFDDDNNNFSLEQDPDRNWLAVKDDKWVAEVPVLGLGYTRISIPFTAFKLENPGSGDGVWNPQQVNGSGGLLKMQIILLTQNQSGEAKASVDNLLLTY